jgi:APA family basic amino acid/polyamine antiporter
MSAEIDIFRSGKVGCAGLPADKPLGMQDRTGNRLSLFDLTMIVIGLVIGMGIFRTASDAARASLTPGVFFGAWVAGGVIALCGALTYAEIGSRLPVTGGYYRVFATAYHPSVAFAVNCIILVSNAASLAGVALIGSEYLVEAVVGAPVGDLGKSLIAMASILLFYVVNLLGLRMSANAQNVLMSVKIGMILLLILALFLPGAAPVVPPVAAGPAAGGWSDHVGSFGSALVAVCFTYGGYQQTINFGGDVRDPRRNLPRGIFTGILVVIVLYLSVSYAYYRLIGFDELKTSRGIAAIVAGRAFGETGRLVFSLLLFLAVLAYVNVILLSNPRVMYAMSLDGILPRSFARQDGRRGVLTVSLTVYALMSIGILFFLDTFDKILGFSIFLDCIGMACSAATLFILRRRGVGRSDAGLFSMRLYPLLPVVFISAYVFVAVSIARDSPRTALTAVGVLAAFVALYFVTPRRQAPPAAAGPADGHL